MIGTTTVEATCPCGAGVTVAEVDGVPAVLHGMPMCADFASREVTEYLHWLNDRLEAGKVLQ